MIRSHPIQDMKMNSVNKYTCSRKYQFHISWTSECILSTIMFNAIHWQCLIIWSTDYRWFTRRKTWPTNLTAFFSGMCAKIRRRMTTGFVIGSRGRGLTSRRFVAAPAYGCNRLMRGRSQIESPLEIVARGNTCPLTVCGAWSGQPEGIPMKMTS